MQGKFTDMTGRRFGTLVVLKRGENRKGAVMWECKCDCGNTSRVSTGDLQSGHTRSCGCRKVDFCRKRATKHNGSNSSLYVTWVDMKRRCHKETDPAYKNYGQRGISVCEEWLDSFVSFRNWANDNGYRTDLTLERINNNGGYCPDNCKWVTMKEQSNNRRNNINIAFNGQTKTLKQWSESIGLSYNTLWQRWKAGWDVPALLQTPQRVVVNGHYSYVYPIFEVNVK